MAKNEAEIAKAAICAPVNDALRNRCSGSIGSATRRSIVTNAAMSAAAPPSSARISALVQPSSLPRSTEHCRLADERVSESSGLAVSTRDPARLWTANDSGDAARLFALGAPVDGRCPTIGVLTLAGIEA